MGAKNKGTLFREELKLSFCMPLSSTNDRQLKNFSVLMQTDHHLGSVLLVEFCWRFQWREMVSDNPRTVARELQLVMKEVIIKDR